MDAEVGGDAAHELDQADVLHDHSIGAGTGDGADRALRVWKLLLEDEDVEGDEDAHAAVVAVRDHVVQLVRGEVGCPGAGVERGETAVHGICSILHRGTQLLVTTRRGEDLRSVTASRCCTNGLLSG